jgi:type VI secretion system protein ImpJ
VNDVAGIFPDGLLFDVPGADIAPAPLPLAPHWQPDQTTLVIYLTIPEHRAGGQNVSPEATQGSTRYRADVILRRDENTGLAEKPIQVASKNLRLVAEGESLEGVVALPVARVKRGTGGALELDAGFVPPVLDISASPHLASIARRLLELLAARSTTLSGMRRERNLGLADFGVSDAANFWLLYTVNTHLPRFRHMLEGGQTHPAVLFRAMLELAGSLMTFDAARQPSDLPAYNHLDLTSCFGKLDVLVRELLETAVPSNYVSLPLRRTESSTHATAVDQDRYFAAPAWYLAVGATAKNEEIARRAPQLLKVSSVEQLERLIRRALPGVALTHVAAPPSAIPLKLNYQYFLLERTGEDWDAIRLSRHLAAYVPAELPDARLELVILLA